MTTIMSFYQYVRQYRKEQSARGDLARDAAKDTRFPRKTKNHETVLTHLTDMGACYNAIDIFETTFRQYKHQLQRNLA